MSFDVSIAGTAVPTDITALKSFKADLNLAFNLDSVFTSLLATTLANVPASKASSKVSYTSPAASWNLGGPITFGLSGGTTGEIDVVTSGGLVDYTDGLDSPKQQSVSVPVGTAYLKLMLSFNISATAGATYSNGAYGVKAALDTSAMYGITFCKAFDPSTPLGTAIAQTFQSFVLPLHSETLNQMSNGDFLLHDFDGSLHLSFGAFAGLDKVLYAGQSSVDVLKTFGSPLATLAGGVKPEIDASATLDFAYQYASNFEALLSKTGTTARLHLFHSISSSRSLTFKAGLTFDANATASITTHTDAIQSSLVNAAATAGPLAQSELTKVLAAAGSEIDKYVEEVNDKLTSWLNRANGLNTNLQAAIETTSSRTVLAGYDFDLASPAYPAAWQEAIGGDFVQALASGAVTLDVGSGMESEYQSKTSFNCNLFNLWNFSTWNNFSSNVSFVYAGNNVFHLVANVGRTNETDSMGAMHTMDFYFAASADVKSASVSNVDISLHIDLTAQNDPQGAAKIAVMLSAIEGGAACDALVHSMNAFAGSSKQGTVQLKVTVPSSAFALLNCDPYNGDKPLTASTFNDAANLTAFASAADDLNAWPLRQMSTVSTQNLAFLKTFNAWEELNVAATGSTTPNRMHTGDPQGNWPEDFPQVDDGSKDLIVYSMLAGQNFMNFCAAVKQLANVADVSSAGVTWQSLLALVTDAIRNDIGVDFLRPAALAIIRLCQSNVSSVSGPSASTVPTSHFAVSLTL